MNYSTKRIISLDLLRGLSVFFMFVSHAVYFFHDYSSFILTNLEKFGNIFCFTSFLALAGASSFIAYLDDNTWLEKRKRLRKRFLVFLLSYYLLAFFIIAKDLSLAFGLARIYLIFNVLSFRLLPSYAEFIPPFVFYSFLILTLGPKIKEIIQKRPNLLIFMSFLFYFIGSALYKLPLPELFIPWKALLFGSIGYYRFPLFQYLPIFSIGLVWGSVLKSTESPKFKKDYSLHLGVIFITIILLTISYANFLNIDLRSFFLRWPPSLPFLFLGLALTFVIEYLINVFGQLKKIKLVRNTLLVLGQNAFPLLWANLLLLNFYQISGGAKTNSIVIFVLLFTFDLVASIALATFVPFNFKIGLNRYKDSEGDSLENISIYRLGEDLEQETSTQYSRLSHFFFPRLLNQNNRLIKKRHLLFLSILVLAFSFIAVPSAGQEIEKHIQSNTSPWWDNQYAYQRQLEISNNQPFNTIDKGGVISLTLNHEDLIKNKKANYTGSDIEIVYWSGKKFINPDYYLESGINTNSLVIKFKTVDSISPGQSINNYYIYYGNPLAEETSSQKIISDKEIKYQLLINEEKSYPFLATLDKNWYLVGNDHKDQYIDLNFVSNNDLISDSSEVSYEISPSHKGGTLQSTGKNKWRANIIIDKLSPGQYQLIVTATGKNSETISSQKTGFHVSYPIYVTWTQDWEGYDVNANYLTAISSISDQYKIPITQMFNPRIYTAADMSNERKTQINDWIRGRISQGDELEMHLHMFYDFVQAAGITPKDTVNWGDKGDGYGSLTTNYNIDEIEQIISYGQSLFVENGLTKPSIYRAGGWFANTETLSALADLGFVADSSGRSKYSFGTNKISGFWDLAPITQPYYPSQNNQNVSAGSDQNKIGILEIPNNGADSYWFESKDMIDRFNQNLGADKILTEVKQVTFLSHPHWFDKKEQTKIEELFTYITKYSFQKDQGPVIFTTLGKVYNEFKE